MDTIRISLEQWRALAAVVEAGGYAQAAAVLHKSQSAVTYAVQKIESQLDVRLFEIQGRKATLTPAGQMLYRRALALLNEAGELEWSARAFAAEEEAEIRLAVEILYPLPPLLGALARFGEESPLTRIEVIESALDGPAESLAKGEADLAISPHIPRGRLGDPLLRLRLLAVAAAAHPLHRLGTELTLRDLRAHRQLTVRDGGAGRERDELFLEARQRWTFSSLAASLQAARWGHGFGWFPENLIRDDLEAGTLRLLPLREGRESWVEFYLLLANPDFATKGVRRLAQIMRENPATGNVPAAMSSI
jgi:DNA-binding transcriptional LysR family regulator